VVFHDLAVPDSDANVDHLVIGPSGVFVIDSKQWTGSVQQGADGLAWHNHYPLDRTLGAVRWEAQMIGRLLGTRAAAVVCVHGAHVHGGGLEAQGVAIVPPHLLRGALGFEGCCGMPRWRCWRPPLGPACARPPDDAGRRHQVAAAVRLTSGRPTSTPQITAADR
jgi:Nuclease-related domain